MYDFWIGTTASHIGLEGASRLDPVDGAKRGFSTVNADQVEELITIELNDKDLATPSIVTLTDDLETLFKNARLFSQAGIGSKVVLHQEPTQGDVWESQVLDGQLQYPPAATPSGAPWGSAPWSGGSMAGTKHEGADPTSDRLRGSLGLMLRVLRQNWWETTEVQLPTYGVLGSDNLNGTVVTNHFAWSNVSNVMELQLDVNNRGIYLPCELRMEIQNLTNTTVGTLLVSQNVSSVAVGQSYVLEDQDATGGTASSDATCSSGSYRACAWSGVTESALLTWPLADTFCQDCAGNYFKPVVRLGVDLAYTDLQFKLKVMVAATSTVVGESAWGPAVAGLRLQELPTLRLPPFVLRNPAAAAGLSLALVARRSTAGSHTIGVDYLQLMPVDGFRRYDTIYPIPQNWKLTDDDPRGIVSTLNTSAEELITHVASGVKFLLQPRVRNSFFFAWMNAAGGMVIGDQLKVKFWATKRMRF